MSESFLPQLIIKIFTIDSNRSYKFFFTLLIVLVTSLSLVLVSIGSAPIFDMPWDVIIQLDGGWKILNGQTPNIDFYYPLGPFSILFTAFGMKVASPSASSIAYGNVLLFLVLTPWAWFIARSRLSSANAFLFALFIGFLLVAPKPLGGDFQAIKMTSYAMLYNRQGFVLLSILLIELFIIPRTFVQTHNISLGGLSSGILLALLLFCKINYFVIGAVAVLVRILIFRLSKTWFVMFSIGFLFICMAMYICLNLNLFALISDTIFMTHAQDRLQRLHNLKGIVIKNFYYLYITFAMIILLLINEPDKPRERNSFLQRTKVQIATAFVAVSGLLICGTNAQDTDIPLFFVAGLILLEYLRREFQLYGYSVNSVSGLKYLFSILIVTSFCGSILVKDIGSVTYAVVWNKLKLPSISYSQRFQSKTLYDLVVPESSTSSTTTTGGTTARDYPQKINDGLTLLRRHLSSDSRIFAMDFSNPFPFALELPPPPGDALFWHINLSFSKESFPDAGRIFEEVSMVMIPKDSSKDDNAGVMQEIYGDYLSRNFLEKDNSQFWTLFVAR